jgi:hypothetical protein
MLGKSQSGYGLSSGKLATGQGWRIREHEDFRVFTQQGTQEAAV